ncbi:septum formation inhibitor Maf [Aureimonas sp. Leaf454]|uniref:Maf-like protein n=1 Tax=Aureimonas sp. Leaf454 TaxID=1736381 RepID=UPI0006FB7EAD|nr:Maf-like protein [Aureimonas sp. Leaf454]KQT43184.1 septum formation inhibitor Maf [Aureimonas sp. Leaf454]
MIQNLEASLVLASGSVHRAKLLADAGVSVRIERPLLDERALEAPLLEAGVDPEDLALVLAEAKAIEVSERLPGALVIGCDQTLSLGDRLFHKPADAEAARDTLLALSGRTHQLNSAVVLARDGIATWRHVAVASMTVRDLDPGFVGRYLAASGAAILSSVGAYQIEGRGIQLMERIEGDHFTIIGLPLLPLLARLREEGAIDG